MRLLVTNPRNRQTYAIVASLRPHADRIVLTTYGGNRLSAWLAPTARSRLVDACYRVPRPPPAWLHRQPTEGEQGYIEALFEICQRERIDLIMPSRDEVAYILARHRQRFAERGVVLSVCDLDVQARAADKWAVVQAAQEAGIATPRTHRPESLVDLSEAIADVGLPLLLKPQFGAGGVGLRWIRSRRQIEALWRPPTDGAPDLLVQEYVLGTTPCAAVTVHLVMDRAGACPAMFSQRRTRYQFWNIGGPLTASTSTVDDVVRSQTVDLLRSLGWWGAACVQWKYDARDGRAKLLEVNPRMGGMVWPACAAGVDIPLALARVALGENLKPMVHDGPDRVYVDPVTDAFAVLTYLANQAGRAVLGRRGLPPAGEVPSPSALFGTLGRSYQACRRVTSHHWRALRHDPLPGLLFWAGEGVYTLRRWRDFVPRW